MLRGTEALTAAKNIDLGLAQGNALLVQLTGTGSPDGTVDFQATLDGATYANTPYIAKNSVTAAKSVAQLGSITTATTYILLPPLTQVRIKVAALTSGTITVVYREVEYHRPFDGALADNEKLTFGDGGDAELYYDGTNLVLNPRAVGTGYVQLLASALGATPADVVALWNATDAATGAQQYSPAMRWHGEGWKTDATAASQNVDWRAYVVPVQGAANPTANLIFQSSINDAAFATRLTLGSDGLLTPGGDISMGANSVRFTDGRVANWGGVGIRIVNAAGSADGRLQAQAIQLTGTIGLELTVDAARISANDADAAYAIFQARDSGVGQVEIGRLAGAADPYIQMGRDDTGVALNAVTDMLVLQAGGGTGNEAANFGLGVSLKIGNAASEVEERGSLDLVLVTATNGAEDVRLDFNLMAAGAMNLAAQLSGAGILDVDLSSGLGAATVGLFDDYDDALVLRQAISQKQIGILENLGIAHRKDTGSGWMLSIQPFLYLLAGGIYQTRQMLEDLLAAKDRQIAALERRMAVLEGIRE